MRSGREHKIALKELLEQTEASISGLSSVEAQKRLKTIGFNLVERAKKFPIIIRYLKQYTNLFAILLMVGAGLSFIAEYLEPNQGNMHIGIALFLVAVLNATFTFYQEYKADRIMQTFLKMMPCKVKVMRDNKQKEILAKNIVPGDIILLAEGDKIPADARLIEQNRLKVDNSALTGESEPQLRSIKSTHKTLLESRNMVFSGTSVLSGTGKALVYRTGMDTQLGQIAQLTGKTNAKEIPIRKELKHFVKIISVIAIIIGLAFFITGLFLERGLWRNMVYMIGIIVANVPEGLLPTVTLSLSLAAQRMARKKALIRNLESVETLGSTTIICTDKTGTITENKMQVSRLFINNKAINADATSLQQKGITQMINACVLCNNATLKQTISNKAKHILTASGLSARRQVTSSRSVQTVHEDSELRRQQSRKFIREEYIGDPMEGALLNYAGKLVNYEHIRSHQHRVIEEPFDSNTKCMITVNELQHKKTAYLKGAPEVVLEKCNKILINGTAVELDHKNKQQILEAYEKFSATGERVLAIAYKTDTKSSKIAPKNNFIFLGLIALLDPPRPEVSAAVAKCKNAGIKVIMITGDFSITAATIARKVGIITSAHPTIITGNELASMSDKKLKYFLDQKEVLFARTNPIQKLRIVTTLQEMGHTVAITGDGVNDAPAIKHADIGIAMGIMGTDVAKEAADMVLMDDNFATIVKAIAEGRTIFDNIKKFIAYILTSNIPEIVPFIAFVLLGIPLPLTVVLILAIDLGTDLLPALGLGSEEPEDDLMQRPPRPKTEHLASRNLILLSYGIIGPIEAIAGFCAYFYVLYGGGWHWGQNLAFTNPLYQQAITAFFVSIIVCQIFNVIARRARNQSILKNIFSNKFVLIGIASEILLTAIIVYLPATHAFFNTHALGPIAFFLPLPFGLLILFGDELRRYLIRQENRFALRFLQW